MYLEWYQIVILITGTIGCTAGVMFYRFKRKDLASFVVTLIGTTITVLTLIWSSSNSTQGLNYYKDNATIIPTKTPIPYTYQPQVILDYGLGFIYLYKWDYVKGKWSYSRASQDNLENLQIYRTTLQFDGEYNYGYHAYLTIPGYTDVIDLGVPTSPYILRTTQGEYEFMIGLSYSSTMFIKAVFDVSSDALIEVDDSNLINKLQ